MSDEPIDPELDSLLDLLAEEERGEPDPVEHPSAATLSAYHARALPADPADQVREHLVACRQCRDQLLDYAQFMASPPEGPADNVSSFEMAAQWKRLRARMYGSRRRLTYAMAAILFAAVLGLSIYALSRSPERFKTLEPLGSYRGAEEVETVQLPVTLLLKSPATTSYPEYRAELRNAHGKVIREFPGLRETSHFDLEIHLGRGDLDAGKYRIDLMGIQGKGVDRVGKYAFNVRR